MTEGYFYTNVVRPGLEPHGKLTRIENLISSGIPDVLYGYNGKLYLFELKLIRNGYIYLEKSQLVWLINYGKLTNDIYIIAGSADNYENVVVLSVCNIRDIPRERYKNKWKMAFVDFKVVSVIRTLDHKTDWQPFLYHIQEITYLLQDNDVQSSLKNI
jgi:Holliday junction resolvase